MITLHSTLMEVAEIEVAGLADVQPQETEVTLQLF
jgi:hypothetical protein